MRALFEGLTVHDPATLESRPGMAERWDVSADGRTYTFHLRPAACWIRPGTDPELFGKCLEDGFAEVLALHEGAEPPLQRR